MPATFTMMAKWTPITERARSVSLVVGASYAGAAVGMAWELVLTQFVEQLGWALLYIGMGVAAIIWFALWLFFVTERPGL